MTFKFAEDESSVLANGDAGEVAGGDLLQRGARGAQLEVEVGMLVMMDVAPHGLEELIKDGRFYRLDECDDPRRTRASARSGYTSRGRGRSRQRTPWLTSAHAAGAAALHQRTPRLMSRGMR